MSSAVAKAERWSDDAEAVGTFVAINGTDVTTESGGVVHSLEFEAGQPVKAGTVLVRLNTANEVATLKIAGSRCETRRGAARPLAEAGPGQAGVGGRSAAARHQAATAQAQVEAQRALIAQKTIRAPFTACSASAV